MLFLTFFLQVTIFFARLTLALAIPIDSPITVANHVIEILPVVRDKAINDLSKYSKEVMYFLRLLVINSLLLISATK